MAGKATAKAKTQQSSPVSAPMHLRQLSTCLEVEESQDVDWRQVQQCLEAIQRLCSNSMFERRAISSKCHSGIPTLLRVLGFAATPAVVNQVFGILNVLCEFKHKLKLVEADCIGALFASFVKQKAKNPNTDTRINHLRLLLKIAPKDKRFATKARLLGAIPCVHVCLQDTVHNKHESSDVTVAINMVKALAYSSVNVSSFHCIGTAHLILKIMQTSRLKNLFVLRCAADAMSSLLKRKNSYTKVAQKTVVTVFPLIEDLSAVDRQQRHTVIQLALLSCLQTATIHSHCCKEVFLRKDGPSKLYGITILWVEGNTKETTNLASLSYRILKRCLPPVTIEVPSFSHPLSFPLPDEDVMPLQDGDTSASDDDDDVNSTSASEDGLCEDLNTGEDALDYCTSSGKIEIGMVLTESSGSVTHTSSKESLETHQMERPIGVVGSEDEIVGIPGGSQTDDVRFGKGVLGDSCTGLVPSADVSKPGTFGNGRESNSVVGAGEVDNRQKCSTEKTLQKVEQTSLLCASSTSVKEAVSFDSEPRGVDGKKLTVTLSSELPSAKSFDSKESGISSDYLDSDPAISFAGRVQSDTSLSQKLSSCNISESSTSLEYPLLEQNLSLGHFDQFFPELPVFAFGVSPSTSLANVESEVDNGKDRLVSKSEDSVKGLELESVSMPDVRPRQEILENAKSKDKCEPKQGPCSIHTVGTFFEVPPFVRYKDDVPDTIELQLKKDPSLDRRLALRDVWKHLNQSELINEVVYDLDQILSPTSAPTQSGSGIRGAGVLHFDSRFESGNLRRAIHVIDTEYDLLLSSDINSTHHHQWFCFKVSGMEAGIPYHFNIINCEKRGSQYNAGMQPVVFSTKESNLTGKGWFRAGTDVAYYANQFQFRESSSGKYVLKSSYTATFTIIFLHSDDACFVAYHYPYLYSDLMEDLHQIEQSVNRDRVFFRKQTLCTTLGGNDCPLLTITAVNKDDEEAVYYRDYVFLSARVHPGESNASWVMRGILKFLVSEKPVAVALREKFTFKIIPMLNPDGVINGSHRCSLAGCDLNRQWIAPSAVLHPTIHFTKGLIQWLFSRRKTPLLFCDFHGHSQIKNVVLYGCPDPTGGTATEELSRLLSIVAPAFSIKGCRYKIEKSKEGTARVVVWKMGVVRSYTMESSYCGAGIGVYKDLQFDVGHLEEMGADFCQALHLLNPTAWGSILTS